MQTSELFPIAVILAITTFAFVFAVIGLLNASIVAVVILVAVIAVNARNRMTNSLRKKQAV